MGYLLAGALTGLGQGLVKQAEAKAADAESARDREFKAALENLRAKNDMATAANTAALNDQNTRKEYGYKDAFEERDAPRKVRVAGEIAQAEGKVRIEVDNARAKADQATAIALEKLRQSGDLTKLRVASQIDKETASGVLDRVEVSGDGTFVKFYKDGRVETTNTTATDRAIYGSQPATSGLFDDVAPKPAAAPAKPAAAPAPKAQAPAKSSGPYRAKNDLDAEMFASNPANKGKVFVGPDGKQYTVK